MRVCGSGFSSLFICVCVRASGPYPAAGGVAPYPAAPVCSVCVCFSRRMLSIYARVRVWIFSDRKCVRFLLPARPPLPMCLSVCLCVLLWHPQTHTNHPSACTHTYTPQYPVYPPGRPRYAGSQYDYGYGSDNYGYGADNYGTETRAYPHPNTHAHLRVHGDDPQDLLKTKHLSSLQGDNL